MIEVLNVSRQYGSFWAVQDLSFSVDAGEIVGLVGPNGAGKTTTMKMITGYLVPSTGRLRVNGIDVVADPTAAQATIGYLPENNPVYPDMSVQDYLVFVGRMRGLSGPVLKERLRFAVGACRIEDRLVRPIATLSKGLRQRVGIAQAIIHDPGILILDEPTSGLDPNQIVEIRDLIRELGRDKTVILSTHILSEVEESCTRALMIVGGRLALDDDIEDLVGARSLLLRIEEADGDPTPVLAAIPGVRSVEAVGPRHRLHLDDQGEVGREVFRVAVSEGWELAEMSVERRDLEDVFRSVSRRGIA
ncbi:MAG: ATP-binding cassette domain-containing protein [Planctomycetes bacterium]|nr:ATP-binding cassette domain-containing protein [Planctomycetota bacterium]